MWCLGRFLPLLIGDLLDEDDDYWEHFLLHAQIIDEVFAPSTSTERIGYLNLLIPDFLHDFKILYPHASFTPKMHYLLHTPQWIKWLVQYLL